MPVSDSRSYLYGQINKSITVYAGGTEGPRYIYLTFDVSDIPFDKVTITSATLTYEYVRGKGSTAYIYDGYTGKRIVSVLYSSPANLVTMPNAGNASSYKVKYATQNTTATECVIKNAYLNVYFDWLVSNVTDPKDISFSSSVAQSSAVLTFTPSQDGIQNTLTGYRYQYRVSSTQQFSGQWTDISPTVDYIFPMSQVSRKDYMQIRVQAMGSAGQNFYSNWVQSSNSVRRNAQPNSPTITSTLPSIYEDESYTPQTLSWTSRGDDTDDISCYRVSYKVADSVSSGALVNPTIIKDVYTFDGDSQAGTTHSHNVEPSFQQIPRLKYFQIVLQAQDTFGIRSSYASFNVQRRNAIPTAPQSVAINTGRQDKTAYYSGTATLSWSSSTDATDSISHYLIEQKIDSKNWTSMKTTSLLSETIAPSSSFSQASYRITAIDSCGKSSDYSSVATIYFKNKPSVPSELTATPPTGLIGSPVLYESGSISIAWKASTAQTQNVTYTVRYRIQGNSGFGNWSNLSAVSTLSTQTNLSQSAQRGKLIEFGIKSTDSNGQNSDWSSSIQVKRNTLPVTPSVLYPVNGGTVHNKKPYFVLSVGQAQNGQNRYVQILLGGTWKSVKQINKQSQTVVVRPDTDMDYADTTAQFRISDVLSAAGSTGTRSFHLVKPSWSRSISSGTVISNQSISHKADITQLRTSATTLCNAYGISPTLMSANGYYADWYTYMNDIRNAIKPVYDMLGIACPQIGGTNHCYPSASVINNVRSLVEEV